MVDGGSGPVGLGWLMRVTLVLGVALAGLLLWRGWLLSATTVSAAPSYVIDGQVRGADGDPVFGAHVAASGGYSATTGSDGLYSLAGLASGTYVLTPTLAGHNFWPATRTVTLPPDATGQDFVVLARTYLPLVARNYPLEGWLAYVNRYRAMAELPSLSEQEAWSEGCWLHARYTVKNDVLSHGEDPGNAWYTPEGDEAARASNLMASSLVGYTDEAAIDGWMQAPFHAVGILDPALSQAGFGSYREEIGTWRMAAALDVIRGLGSVPPEVSFPVAWPADGQVVPLTAHGGEYPDPLTSCPGYTDPSGLPIILQVGPGHLSPDVTGSSFKRGNTSLEHCVFDETSYVNPDGAQQSLGRGILASRDAIVLIPRAPLTPGATYTASITVGGETHTWSFTVANTAHRVTGFWTR